MAAGKTVVLQTKQPTALTNYSKAVLGMIPGFKRTGLELPTQTLALKGLTVDRDNLAAYTEVCGLRFGDRLPITYPFVLGFPSATRLLVSRDYPFPAIGSVHVENNIESLRPVSVSEPLDLEVHVENLREHRKGILVDAITEVRVGRELVWRQTSTLLRLQRTSLSDAPKEEREPETPGEQRPVTSLRVTESTISRYAAVSGDRNPIHISTLGAKAFGFPKTIAHGMWSAAAVLGALEGRLPEAVNYNVRFGKPVLLPAKIDVYADQTENGWDLELRHPTKGYPHLTATVTAR